MSVAAKNMPALAASSIIASRINAAPLLANNPKRMMSTTYVNGLAKNVVLRASGTPC